MSSLEVFRSSINDFTDFAKTSRFWVTIDTPPTGGDTRLLRLRCTEAELPGRTFSAFDNRTYGLMQKYPSQTMYGELNLQFLCSGNRRGSIETGFAEKKIFEDWMDYINPTENSATNITDVPLYNFRYKSQYARDITIQHYDIVGEKNAENSNLSYAVKFIECFPLSINQVSLSWGNEDVAKLIVVFAYKRWQRESSPINNTISESDVGQIKPPVNRPTSTENASAEATRIDIDFANAMNPGATGAGTTGGQ